MEKTNKLTVFIFVLNILALSLCTLIFIDFLLVDNNSFDFYTDIIFHIRLFHWGWPLVIIFSAFSIIGIFHWKPYKLLLRVTIAILSLITLFFGLFWLFLYILGRTFPT